MKIKNIQASAFLQNLTKAYTEGVYADTPQNRKLGRVGMSYGRYQEKLKEGKEVESGKKSWDVDDAFYKEGTDEGKLLHSWHRYKKTGDYAYVSDFQQIMEEKFPKVASWKMGSPNSEYHQITAMSENGKRIAVLNLEDYSNIPAIQTFMDKCDAYKGGDTEDFEYPKIVEATTTLKNLSGSKLDHVIAYSNSNGVEGIKIKKGATDAEKREAIAEFYYDDYVLSENPVEDADSLDEIVEDALADYVSKKNSEENVSLSSFKDTETRDMVKKALNKAKSNKKPFIVGHDEDNNLWIDDAIDYFPGLDKNGVIATCFPNGDIKRGFVEIEETDKYSKEEDKKIPLSSISVKGENQYKFWTGKSPRGRGNWAFKIGNDDVDKDPSKIFWFEGMYEEAKNQAKKEAQKRNVYSITVLT